jgi:hypothetical protein
MNETRITSCGTSLWDARVSRRTLDRLVRTALRNPDRPGPIAHLIRSSAPQSGPESATAPERRSALVRLIADELRRWTKLR